MADHALFYNSVDHDRVYNADSFSDWLKKFFTTGVFTGDLFVTAAGSMNVSVGTGYVNINGKVMIYGAATQLTLDPANGIYPRIDTIVVERNDTDRDFTLKVVTGDYANLNDPVPTPPVRSGAVYQLVLAQIYVGAGVTEITQANITDTRADDELCGIVTGTVEEMDFTQFSAQFRAYYNEFKNGYEADFDNWSDAQRQNFANWMADEENTFDTWFANLHYVLDGDVAGHLQNEIDALAAGMTGSIFEIHTNESTLIGKTVTVTDGTTSMTATINNAGDAEIRGFDEIGNITITATDGDQTATTVVNVPYFGNYSVTLAFWQAIVNIQGDENLYGEDIQVSNSSHILVQTITLDSEGQGTFYASRPDTYTFTATYSGETYSESVTVSEETTYSVELMTMPNGETVTPTDDIQIWLKCAGITDKSYTTLSEVLADSETYNALLGDSNACAYMARSTTWAGSNEGLVPAMTSATTPSGTVTWSSSLVADSYDGWRAFSDGGNGWIPTDEANPWVKYDFGSAVLVDKMSAKSLAHDTVYAFKVKIAGSNDDSTYVDLATDLEFSSDGNTNYYEFDNSTAYRYYKITYTYKQSSSFNINAGVKFQLFYRGLTGNQSAMSLLGRYDTACDALLSDATWASAIANSDYYEYVLNTKVPTMTSNTTPSGEVIYGGTSASQFNATTAYYLFDGSTSTNSYFSNTEGGYPDSYIGYDFGTSVIPRRIYLKSNYYSGSSADYGIKEVIVKGSNDKSTWVEIGTISNPTNAQITEGAITIGANTGAYRYIALQVTLQGGSGYAYNQTVEVQIYARTPSSDKIHGATNDSFYILDGGSPVTITDPSTLDAGTYTVYSTVAKDPSNLSNDYSKTIRICPNTKEIVVMPDGALYWWGWTNGTFIGARSAGLGVTSVTTMDAQFRTNDIWCQSNQNNYYYAVGNPVAIPAGTELTVISDTRAQTAQYYIGKTKSGSPYDYGTDTIPSDKWTTGPFNDIAYYRIGAVHSGSTVAIKAIYIGG